MAEAGEIAVPGWRGERNEMVKWRLPQRTARRIPGIRNQAQPLYERWEVAPLWRPPRVATEVHAEEER